MWFSMECWAWQIISVPRSYLFWNGFHSEAPSRFSRFPVPCQVQPCKLCRSALARLQYPSFDQSATIFVSFLVLEGNAEMCMIEPASQVISFSLQELDWKSKDVARWAQEVWMEKVSKTWSKCTTKGKSSLNVFLLWVSPWEVRLKLSLLQQLAGVSLINEEMSHVRTFTACTCVCIELPWKQGEKAHEPEHALHVRNTCAVVKLHPEII